MIAPYATVLAALVDPVEGGRELAAARSAGGARAASGSTTRSITRLASRRTPSPPTRPRAAPPSGSSSRSYFAHHQGMSLVALANVLTGRRDGRPLPLRSTHPSHASSCSKNAFRVERPLIEPRPAERNARRTRRACARLRDASAHPHTPTRTAQILSNGALHDDRDATPAAARALARPRGHALARGSHARPGKPVHLPARRSHRQRLVRHASADRQGGRRLLGRVSQREGRASNGAITTSTRAWRSPSLPRTMPKCAGSR